MSYAITIKNQTRYPTRELRKIIVRAARQVDATPGKNKHRLDERGLRYRVEVGYTRGGFHGGSSGECYHLGYGACVVRLPRGTADPHDFAYVVAHELAHCAGQKHADMRGCPWWTRKRRGRSFAWAWTFVLEEKAKPKKARPDGYALAAKRLEESVANLSRWEAKLRRAQTAIKKYRRRIRYYQRRLDIKAAAVRPKGDR